jgi:hypothetical protein
MSTLQPVRPINGTDNIAAAILAVGQKSSQPASALRLEIQGCSLRLAPTRSSKRFSTLNIEDQTVIYALQQCPLNGPLNLEDAARFSIDRISLNGFLSI